MSGTSQLSNQPISISSYHMKVPYKVFKKVVKKEKTKIICDQQWQTFSCFNNTQAGEQIQTGWQLPHINQGHFILSKKMNNNSSNT